MFALQTVFSFSCLEHRGIPAHHLISSFLLPHDRLIFYWSLHLLPNYSYPASVSCLEICYRGLGTFILPSTVKSDSWGPV